MKLQDAWTVPNLNLAWRRLTTGKNIAYKRYYRPLYNAYEISAKENIKDLHERLKGGSYLPQAPSIIYVPKPSGLQRPITLLCIEDQIVLQAIANIFARKLMPRRRRLENKCIFSNIIQNDHNSIFFLQDWRFSYTKFQAKIKEYFDAGFRWIALFDLAAFFDTICHDLLLRTAFPRSPDVENRTRILDWLKKWSSELTSSGHAHGIPQGPIASNYLAECFLLPIDEILYRKKMKYVRYVDDIRLFAKSEDAVRKAVLEMELVLRGRGLIPQGKKHDIVQARTLEDAMGILPSIEPHGEDNQPDESALSWQDAIKKIRSAITGKPQAITDKTRARYVLFHSEPSPELLAIILRMLPRHPEQIDAFVHYLSQCKPSRRIIRSCEAVLRTSPYEYVLGEMWHILARMMKPGQMHNYLNRAIKTATNREAGLAAKWGACHFLCEAETAGLGKYAKFAMFQENTLLQALIVPFLPDGRFGRNDVAEKILRRSAPEAGIALAEPFVRLGLTHQSFGVKARSLPKPVQNVFRQLGIIKGPVPAVDPLSEILSRRYRIPQWDGWKNLLGREYSHALQLLAISDSAYHIARSYWLSYQNSFNQALFLALQNHLFANRLSGAAKTKGKDGKLIKFGTLVDAQQPFARSHPTIAGGFREANVRRNELPASHAYKEKGGERTRLLSKREQDGLTKKLSISYRALLELLAPSPEPGQT